MARGRVNRTAQTRRPGKSVRQMSQADGTAIAIAKKVTLAASPIVDNKVLRVRKRKYASQVEALLPRALRVRCTNGNAITATSRPAMMVKTSGTRLPGDRR